MAEAYIETTIASQLESIGMMNRHATIFTEDLYIIPHSSHFVRLMDRHIGVLLCTFVSYPTKGENPPVAPPSSGHLEIAQLMPVPGFLGCSRITAASSSSCYICQTKPFLMHFLSMESQKHLQLMKICKEGELIEVLNGNVHRESNNQPTPRICSDY